MSDTGNGQPTGIVGTVINELEHKIESLIHPGTQEVGAAAVGEPANGAQAPATGTSATAAIDSASSASTAMLASGSQAANFLNLSDAPAVATSGESSGAPVADALTPANAMGSGDASLNPMASGAALDGGDAGNVAAASGAIGGAPGAASPSEATGPSSDQSGAATNGASVDPNVGASTDADSGSSSTDNTAATAITQRSSVGDVAIAAGTAVLAAAEESASAAADALLARWHREMSLLGRGLSAETEKLIRDTAAYLGV